MLLFGEIMRPPQRSGIDLPQKPTASSAARSLPDLRGNRARCCVRSIRLAAAWSLLLAVQGITRCQGEGLMQWDQTARSDAAVIGPPQRASINLGTGTLALPLSSAELEVPHYLNAHYWWAYIHPTAVQLFERQWLINLILWGNYARLRDAVMAEMGDSLPVRTLQVACAYGDLTTRLSARVADGGLMDIVDMLPIQLSN